MPHQAECNAFTATVHLIWSCYDLDLWPMSARTLSAIPTHIVNICGKLHQNPSTNYRDLASSKIGDNGHTMYGQPDGRLKTECLSLSNVGSRGV